MKIIENFANLIKVKTLVTICVMAVWAFLAVTGKIDGAAVRELTLVVVSFYFGTQAEREKK